MADFRRQGEPAHTLWCCSSGSHANMGENGQFLDIRKDEMRQSWCDEFIINVCNPALQIHLFEAQEKSDLKWSFVLLSGNRVQLVTATPKP